jgi:hypothetical protein
MPGHLYSIQVNIIRQGVLIGDPLFRHAKLKPMTNFKMASRAVVSRRLRRLEPVAGLASASIKNPIGLMGAV